MAGNVIDCQRFRLLMMVVILAAIVSRTTAEGEVLCVEAVAQLLPCGEFLKNTAAKPNATCCSAVRSLDKLADESQDIRKILCECFTEPDDSLPTNTAIAQQLPKLCNATDNLKFGPNLNCNNVKLI